MVLGYSTNAFTKFSLLQAVDKIAGLGFKGVEIMGDRPHLYPPDYDRQKLDTLVQRLRNRHLTVTNINSFTLFAVGDTYLPSWIEPERERREIRIRHTLESIRMAAELACRNISVPPGGPLNGGPRGKAMALFYQGLERVIPLAEKLGVKILVEPEPGLMIERTSQFLDFIKGLASETVGCNFDIGHFYCVNEEPLTAFETLFDWIGHVHVEDIAASRVHQHLIAGEGAIAFKEVFEGMLRLQYAGHMSLELYPYVDRPEEAGSLSLQYLRPILQEVGLPVEL